MPKSENDPPPSSSTRRTGSMLSPNHLVTGLNETPAGDAGDTVPNIEPGDTNNPHTQSFDGAVGLVPQIDNNHLNQLFMEYPSYGWGSAEWGNLNGLDSLDEYDLSSIPAVEILLD